MICVLIILILIHLNFISRESSNSRRILEKFSGNNLMEI